MKTDRVRFYNIFRLFSLVVAVFMCGSLSISAQRVTDGLQALYTFEDVGSNVVSDVSGVGSPLDLTIGDPDAVLWLFGGGLRVLDNVLIASPGPATKIITACQVSSAVTVEAWVTPASDTLAGPSRIVTLSGDLTSRNVTLGQASSLYVGNIRTSLTGDDGNGFFSLPGAVKTELTHVVLTRDPSGQVIMYVNGIAGTPAAVGGDFANWDAAFRLALADEVTGNSRWLGDYHLVALYDRALSDAEVVQNFGGGSGGNEVPPGFYTPLADVSVTEPASALFEADAGGTEPLFYEWRRDGTPIPGAQAVNYVLLSATTNDSGATFQVVVSNAFGSVTSRTAVLTVTPFVPEPAAIITQPSDLTVDEPGGASFTVVTTGTAPLSYQWRRDGVDVSGALNTWFTVDPTVAGDNGAAFDVVVSNDYGVVTSAVAVLTVNPDVPSPPGISRHPQDVAVVEPDAADFTVSVAGDRPMFYRWFRNDVEMPNSDTNVYSLDPTRLADSGAQFRVTVSNAYGFATSRVATLTVAPYVPTPATITQQPVDRTVTEPAAAGFTVTAAGDAPLFYQWRRDGVAINAATGTSYVASPTSLTDDGSGFDVVVSNVAGVVTSRTARLTVEAYVPMPAGITQQPGAVTVTEPAAASFTVAASGATPLFYQWRRDGAPVAGANLANYTLSPTTLTDDGARFDAVVSNLYGAVTSTVATLTVNPLTVPASIIQHPQNRTVFEPAATTFTVVAAGDTPLNYQWRRDGADLAGATNASYTLDPTVAADDGAGFDVVVSNPYGTVTSDVAVLTVVPLYAPPVVVSDPADRTVKEPNAVVFSVRASGSPPLSYQWRINGTPVDGATAWDYTYSPTAQSDDGSVFDAIVTGPGGSVTSDVAVLTVTPSHQPPHITLQPADRTVTAPAAVAFSVRATGDPPLSYQWRRNGVAVPAATVWDYVIAATTVGDDGAAIEVVVSNPGGVTTSAVATLSVEAPPEPPVITREPASLAVIEGLPASFSIEATGPDLRYQWRRDGGPIAGGTGSTFVVASAPLSDHGAIFDIQVSNDDGTVTSSPATLTVTDEPHQWRRPTLSWTPVDGATWYQLWIRRNGKTYYTAWLNQTDTEWTASFDFAGGDYEWWVQGWGPSAGASPWSGPNRFSLPVRVPAQAVLVSPSGALSAGTPVFDWQADTQAFWSRVYVSRHGVKYGVVWVPWQDGSTYTFPQDLPLGQYQWWVQTWSPDGYGPWSASMSFSLGAVTPLSPTGMVQTTASPTFVWTAAPATAWYNVYLSRDGNKVSTAWVDGATNWVPETALSSGTHQWWVRAWHADGYGPWSGSASFVVPVQIPDAIVPLAPTGTVTTTSLDYTWRADPRASWYRLTLQTSAGSPVLDQWYEAPVGTDPVVVAVSGHVPGQSYQWWIQGWGSDGYGPAGSTNLFDVAP